MAKKSPPKKKTPPKKPAGMKAAAKKTAKPKPAPKKPAPKVKKPAAKPLKRKGPPKIALANAFFSVNQPLPGRAVMVRNFNAAAGTGTIKVSVNQLDNRAVSFYCKVGDNQLAVTPPGNVGGAAGFTQLSPLLPGTQFQALTVPVSNLVALGNPPQAVKWIGIGAYAAAGGQLAAEVYQFIAVPAESLVSVPAAGCLFFAYTAAGAVLPHPLATAAGAGEALPANAPIAVPAPIDALTVLISVPLGNDGNPQTWTHSGGHSGVPVVVPASGQAGDSDDTDAAYVNPTLNSQNITPLPSPGPVGSRFEGLLAGMWDDGLSGAGAPNPTAIIPVGVGLGGADGAAMGIAMPGAGTATTPLNLMFGSHEEADWGPAHGSLNVSVTWS